MAGSSKYLTNNKLKLQFFITRFEKLTKLYTFFMFKSLKFNIIALFLVLSYGQLSAQQSTYIIQGKITDANTNEPIPFANVIFKGTTIGTTTDFDGKYKLTTKIIGDSLTVMVVNYKTRVKKVKKTTTQTIDYQLEQSTFELGEVVIQAGENPAFPIIRKARENRKMYNQDNIDAFEYKSYVKVDISIDKISESFRNSKTFKPYTLMFDSLKQAAGEDGKITLPFFVSEQLSNVFYLKSPERHKSIVKANKITGLVLDNFQIFESFIGRVFQDYNFNNNFQMILDRSFITPLAAGCFGYYDYYIMDTVLVDQDSCFELKIKAKRPQDLAFNGKIWITQNTFALRRLDLEVTNSANLNFVERYKIQQDLEPQTGGIWMPTKTRVLIDGQEFGDSAVGLIGKFYIANKDFVLNKPRETAFYRDNVIVEMASRTLSEDYWSTERRKMITDAVAVENSYKVIDSLRKSERITLIRRGIRTLWDGYYNFGDVQLGHWYTFFGNNKVEGFRLQATAQTTIKWNYNWILKGHVAYGFKDEKVKYMGQVEYFLDRNKWKKLGFRHTYDMMKLGVDPDFLESHVFLNWLFLFSSQFGYLERMSLTRQTRAWYETDHWHGWSSKFMITQKHFNPQIVTINPKSQDNYVFAWLDDNKVAHKDYNISEITFVTSYSTKRLWLVEDNWRIGTEALKTPLWTFKVDLGFKGILGSDFTFQKVSVNVMQKWRTGYFGQLDYSLTGQMVFGKVPYPEAIIFQGNEPVFSAEKAFNMMNFFEFVGDKSIEGIFLHHFDGLFFNRIPLLKKLKWREVAGFNFILSSYDKTNMTYNETTNPDGLLPETYIVDPVTKIEYPLTTFKTMTWDKPYMEVSYGIENIFKVFRLQIHHRLSYLDVEEGGKKVWPIMIKGSFTIRL